MSQIYKNSSGSGPVPPTVPTSFVTDVNSPSVPALNIENVIGGQTSANTTAGIRTDGSSGGNTLTVQLTNRLQGAVTTSDATITPIVSFSLSATPGVYSIVGTVVAFDTTDTAGGSFDYSIVLRSTGAAVQFIGSTLDNIFLEPAVAAINLAVTSSGNTFILEVVGLAGTTIDWNTVYTYTFVS